MIMLRLICAGMAAWAMNWALNRPAAEALVTDIPELTLYGPLAGALVGFFLLSKRAGNGLVISLFNGVWASVVSIALTVGIYLTIYMINNLDAISDFEAFMRVLGQEAKPLIAGWVNLRLVGFIVAGSGVVGVLTEIFHWALVRLRAARGEEEEESLV